MSYFKPYDVYATRLPVLKPGHLLKIGDKFYQVIVVRRNRKKVAVSGAKTSKYIFYTTTGEEFTPMVGNLNTNRVVHLQYVSIDQDTNTVFYWGAEPLLSKDRAETLQTWGANLLAPLEIDRWSFDEAMNLQITQADSQNYYFEIIEYEVVAYAGTPTRPYLYVMPNGQAIFVSEEATAKSLAELAQSSKKVQ